jgi:hypothetical protein
MKVRLVAYRPALSTDTVDTTYELDLQEAPNISLNFQFSDIKEPETRKASYSQTFKLPFTDTNNEFFQNWFDVNLTTLVFSTRTKFSATIYVGTTPQFEGFLQLKGVYKKAQYYEVVVMSNTADLFTVIGEQKLKDVFRNDDGTYSDELNHTFTAANIKLSWDGDNSAFENTSSVSLRDTDVDVQKVMYPITVTKPNFFYKSGTNEYLAMSDPASNANAGEYTTDITQLRPAIQLKTLFKLIIAKAGMSYTSTFIDSNTAAGNYFGHLYMTLGNQLEVPALPTEEGLDAIGGGVLEAHWNLNDEGVDSGYMYPYSGLSVCVPDINVTNQVMIGFPHLFRANIETADNDDVWHPQYQYFTKTSPTQLVLNLKGRARVQNIKACGGEVSDPIPIKVWLQKYPTFETLWVGYMYEIVGNVGVYDSLQDWEFSVPIDSSIVNLGDKVRVWFDLDDGAVQKAATGQPWLGLQRYGEDGKFGEINCTWLDYTPSQYDGVVDIPACIDPEITQKGFLKDIIERFNLVFITDPDNPNNIIIEPYDDYLKLGEIKNWTDKLDLSKEIVVRDTTSLQKRIINLTDLEDEDSLNKAIKEELPRYNVWGKYYNNRTDNDFAQGELKNNPIFSPYINEQVYKESDTSLGTHLKNFVVQYEISYKRVENGFENVLEETNPKLFYYSGITAKTQNNAAGDISYYLHQINTSTGAITTHEFDSYPPCTAWDITPSSDEYTLSSANKSLFWSFAPPHTPSLAIFNYNESNDDWQGNSLYYVYWRNYLNSIYNAEARIMEAHFQLSSVDIFNFKFNDEVFIKDSYWRIINIHNYQVGENTSTKVVLLKVIDSLVYEEGVNYVAVGSFLSTFLVFCPSGNTGCTPDTTAPDFTGLFADEASCIAFGGEPWTNFDNGSGLFPCLGDMGSLPVKYKTQLEPLSITARGQLKTLLSGKLGGRKMPFVIGSNTDKFSQNILSNLPNDLVVKYRTKSANIPKIIGESHRLVLVGNTSGNTRGYAYPDGFSNSNKIKMPPGCNMMISVKGIATVIGGTSTNYVVGVTESFAYNTAFKSDGGLPTQIGTAGGTLEWSIKDPGLSTTATLYISASSTSEQETEILFGLDDSQTDTKRTWTLNADIVVQQIDNLSLPYDENWALWQDYSFIAFQDSILLIWN